MTWPALALAALIIAAVAYSAGHRSGVAEHRKAMQTAAEEWRRCWLGDPVRASQLPKPPEAKP